jgi:uncharacterized protein
VPIGPPRQKCGHRGSFCSIFYHTAVEYAARNSACTSVAGFSHLARVFCSSARGEPESRPGVRYFQILEDTLLASRVPAIPLGIRTKETTHPKFFLFDTGVARAAAGLVREQVDPVWKGFAFEALLAHEIRGRAVLADKDRPLFHYSVSGSFDIDFLVQTRPKTLSAPPQFVAIEAKLGRRFKPSWAAGLRTLLTECGSRITRGIIVYFGTDRLEVDGIDVLPVTTFLNELHAGGVVG